MSGDEHGKKVKATKGRKLIDGLERSELMPKLLVPTPAQLERGERVIDADPEIWCDQVRQMVRRVERHGWNWRVTYSQFMAIPAVSGYDAGQWVDTHALVVRCAKAGTGRAWGCWHGTARRGWEYESGQFWGLFMARPTGVTSTELNGLVAGTMMAKAVERTGGYVVEKVAQPVAAGG